jgi:hypothetical protein
MNHGARARSMGNAYIALADEPTAIFFNPAGLSKTDQIMMKSSVQNIYGITDLYTAMAACSAPIPYARVGFAWTQVSLLDEYTEQVFYLSAASILRPLGIPVRFGTSIKALRVETMNYAGTDNPSNFDLIVGMMIDAGKDLSLAFTANNILTPDFKILTESEETEREFKTGVCYNWRKSVNFVADYVWNAEESFWNLGGEMWFYDVFAARLGMNDDKLTTGFGVKHRYFTIDGALLSHTSLGSTYRVSVGVKLGGKK